jgi:hypothetical protein
MTDDTDQKPPTLLELIDEAEAAAKIAAHSCRGQKSRDHFEFALALIRESWIAESGQEARSAARVVADVRSAMELFAAAFNRKGGN